MVYYKSMYSRSILKKIVFPVAFVLVLFIYSDVFSSPLPKTASSPNPKYQVEEGVLDISAKAYAVFDVETGEVLASGETEKVLPIASVTKLITAVALVNSFDMDSQGVVTASDVATEGESGKLQAGEKYQYRELLFPLLLESSNDTATFFERETKGEVVLEMNNLAQKVGMSKTKFADASGLSDNNQSTVSDLVKFLRYLNQNESYVLDITNLKQYVGPYNGHLNNSPVFDDNYRGGKHGYTLSANRTLVSLFEEDFGQTKRTLGYVLLGSNDLANDTEKLRNFVANSVTYE